MLYTVLMHAQSFRLGNPKKLILQVSPTLNNLHINNHKNLPHCWSVVLVAFIIQMYCLKGWGYLHLNVLSKRHLDHSPLNLTDGKGKKNSQGLFQPVCFTGDSQMVETVFVRNVIPSLFFSSQPPQETNSSKHPGH